MRQKLFFKESTRKPINIECLVYICHSYDQYLYIQLNFYTHFIDKTWIYGQDTRRYTMKDTWLIKKKSTWMKKKNVYRIDVYNNRYEFNVLNNTYRIQILMRYTFQNILTKTNSSYMDVLGIIEKVSNSWTQYPSRKIIGAHHNNN